AQGIPHRIEPENVNRQAARYLQQMIDQAECFVVFADPGVNFGESSGGLRPIKSIFRFRQQFDCLPSFTDRFLFQAHARKNNAELSVTSRIARSVTDQFFGYSSGVLERRLRPRMIALIQIETSFQESFWTRGGGEVRQCLSRELL